MCMLDKDDVVKVVEAASRNARKLFMIMVLTSLYIALTVGTTTDA